MRSNYKRLGDYIQEVKIRNREEKAEQLLGINIDKFFMPSVANVVGTDLSVYKLVRKNQFACNRMHVGRDYRLPISMSKSEEEFMVSPAYDVFEVKDTDILNPEFLMMWFSRKEFDRNAWFYTDADVRGGLPWKSFCDMQLLIPHPDKQREIVKEYNTIQNRINLNKQLIQKLEETAQAIYREWFVEFEFPDEKGKPYRSNGGEMVWCEEFGKEIPKGWKVDSFTKVIKLSGGGTPSTEYPEYWDGEIPFYTPGDLNQNYYCIGTAKKITDTGLQKCSSKLFSPNTTFVTARGATVGGITMAGIPMAMNQTCYAVNGQKVNDYFAHQLTLDIISKLKTEAIGATFEALVTKDFDGQIVVDPLKELVKLYGEKAQYIYSYILNSIRENQKLTELKELLLSKLATN
jgi:type I restriction enzyme, S subunit